MEDISVLGICSDYTPSSSAFFIDLENYTLALNKNIDTITKISCYSSTNLEDMFKVLDNNYANIHLSLDIRIDYICDENNLNFHILTIDKLVDINLGQSVTKRNSNIESEILDFGVNNICNNKIDFYTLSIISLV